MKKKRRKSECLRLKKLRALNRRFKRIIAILAYFDAHPFDGKDKALADKRRQVLSELNALSGMDAKLSRRPGAYIEGTEILASQDIVIETVFWLHFNFVIYKNGLMKIRVLQTNSVFNGVDRPSGLKNQEKTATGKRMVLFDIIINQIKSYHYRNLYRRPLKEMNQRIFDLI